MDAILAQKSEIYDLLQAQYLRMAARPQNSE